MHLVTDTGYDFGSVTRPGQRVHRGFPYPSLQRSDQPGPIIRWVAPARLLQGVAEWYNFRDFSGSEVLVLTIFDETSYEGGAMGDIHSIAHAQEYHRGRFS